MVSYEKSGEQKLDSALENWLKWDKNCVSRDAILKLAQEKNWEELKKCLLGRMEFGTAGLRAEMGVGNARMNDLTIIQTTQGFCKYLQSKFPNDLQARGVVIGFDSRHNSTRFATLATNVFVSEGIKVYVYSQIVPTPFVPYAVHKYKACAGIMVTASHNPKQDNGYKVYWENASQIIPPHDAGISLSILNNLEPWSDDIWDDASYKNSPLIINPLDDVMESYYVDLKKYCLYSDQNKSTTLKFTYTPVHGVGLEYARESFKTFKLPMFEDVPEQMNPDPEFSTVKYPNPEEGKGVLKLSMRTADASGCRVILANDPDADRLAVAEKQEDGSWKVFTGNELGALFGWWAWHCHHTRNPNKSDHSDVYMLCSTVSSMILKSIAGKEGFNFEDTLTGFKWMGNRANELINDGKIVLFAFEEAIGYMFGENVLDKDGISTMSVIAECACDLNTRGITLTQQLQNIYSRYGDHVSNNSYFISHGGTKTDAMFSRLRNCNDENVIVDSNTGNRYPASLGRFKISGIRDLTTGFDSRLEDEKATLPSSATSHMITFYFENGVVLTIRTSGTEPKIKYYSEICGKVGVQRDELVSELSDLVSAMEKDFYQPEVHGFLARST